MLYMCRPAMVNNLKKTSYFSGIWISNGIQVQGSEILPIVFPLTYISIHLVEDASTWKLATSPYDILRASLAFGRDHEIIQRRDALFSSSTRRVINIRS